MNIEKEIFKKGIFDFKKLQAYGFQKEKQFYYYSQELMKNFEVQIKIDLKGNVSGKIYDLKMNDEYTNFRIETLEGFSCEVREKYIALLKNIAQYAFIPSYFIKEQSNRITHYIIEKYKVFPEFLWEAHPHYGVFRNKKSNKWFGVIMNVDKSKIIPSESGEIEILNLKLDDQVAKFLNSKGIYLAYHMNKKSWVSIILDDTLNDEEIMNLVDISYGFTNISHSWVIPANPKYYDIISEFSHTDVVWWHQDVAVMVQDIVYIYLTRPIQAIMFQCEVVEANVYEENAKYMKLKLLKKYHEEEFSLDKLKKYGLKSVRSARRISSLLSKELEIPSE